MIMEADTIIHPKEVEYMDSILADFSMSIADNDHLDNMDFQYCLTIIQKMSKEKREMARQLFYNMASIDGFVDPREKNLIDAL